MLQKLQTLRMECNRTQQLEKLVGLIRSIDSKHCSKDAVDAKLEEATEATINDFVLFKGNNRFDPIIYDPSEFALKDPLGASEQPVDKLPTTIKFTTSSSNPGYDKGVLDKIHQDFLRADLTRRRIYREQRIVTSLPFRSMTTRYSKIVETYPETYELIYLRPMYVPASKYSNGCGLVMVSIGFLKSPARGNQPL